MAWIVWEPIKSLRSTPAAAMTVWGLPADGYKDTAATDKRRDLLGMPIKRAPWLELNGTVREVCHTSDHCFDALIASLVTRAAALGFTALPARGDHAQAQLEGWIHLPRDKRTLEALVAD